MDALEECLPSIVVGEPFEKEEIGEQILVRLRGDIGMRDDRLDLGSEDQPAAVGPVIQRAAADRVAREDEPTRTRIEQGEREFPLEPAEELLSPFVPRSENQRRVRGAGDRLTAADCGEQISPVVQPPVEQHNVPRAVRHRLALSDRLWRDTVDPADETRRTAAMDA